MKTSRKFWLAYFVIALLFAIYGSIWGAESYKGFAYNLGMSVIWPAILFPVIGKIVGGIIFLIFIAFLVFSR